VIEVCAAFALAAFAATGGAAAGADADGATARRDGDVTTTSSRYAADDELSMPCRVALVPRRVIVPV
jgi:hypothetical protein